MTPVWPRHCAAPRNIHDTAAKRIGRQFDVATADKSSSIFNLVFTANAVAKLQVVIRKHRITTSSMSLATPNVPLPVGDSTSLKRTDGLWFGAEKIQRGRINMNGTRGGPPFQADPGFCQKRQRVVDRNPGEAIIQVQKGHSSATSTSRRNRSPTIDIPKTIHNGRSLFLFAAWCRWCRCFRSARD